MKTNYAFVSYSHKNREIVSDFVLRLRSRKVNVWFDKELDYGSHWDSIIMSKLQECSVVFIFISEAFAKSKYCSKEFDIAVEMNKTIIPVLLDKDVDLPSEMKDKLHMIHHLSFYDYSEGCNFEVVDKVCKLQEIKNISTDGYCRSGFGPDRRQLSHDDKVDYPVFNSVTDHPVYGNEFRFLRVKLPDTDVFVHYNGVYLRPGKTYEFEIIIHNNADAASNNTGTGVAYPGKAFIKLPNIISPSKPGEVVSLIRASNANPSEVWDSIELRCDRPMFMEYVPGSAVLDVAAKGLSRKLPLHIFDEMGYWLLGFGPKGTKPLIPAGEDYIGRISFKVRVRDELASAQYKKIVMSEDGELIDRVKIGEVFTVRTEFENTGDCDLLCTIFRDTFPEGMELIPETTMMTNNANPLGLKMKDNINANGWNTGLYGPGATCVIEYKARFVEGEGRRTIRGIVSTLALIRSSDVEILVDSQ